VSAGLLLSFLPCEARAGDEPKVAAAKSPAEASAVRGYVPSRAPFQQDRYRFPELTIERRILVDALALPLAPLGWQPLDWAAAGLAVGVTGALMLPAKPSGDVRVMNWAARRQTPFLDDFFFKVYTVDAAIVTVGLLGVGWIASGITRNRKVWELTSLTTEAVALAQFYHLTFKILLGRESPYQEQGQGEIHGPTFKYFPGGTPSGHAANLAAFTGTIAEYFDSWWLRAPAFAVSTYAGASLVYNEQHFPSDVVWGASLGFSTARWVVRNRSSHFRYGGDTGESELSLLPFATPSSAGLTAMGLF